MMLKEARVEVDGNEVTIVIVASTPEEAQMIARQATVRLEVTPADVTVVVNGEDK